MKKFLMKSLLFLLPVALLYAAELFVIPIDKFCYRGFEALRVIKLDPFLHGYFYPNMDVETVGQGDLGLYTSHAKFKKEHWITDPYGYRTEGGLGERYDVVILGDSFSLSPGTLQENSFAAVLERKSGMNVYPFATRYFEEFMAEKRFMDSPPKYVVLERIEDNMIRFKPFPEGASSGFKSDITDIRLQSAFIMTDRIFKSVFFRYARGAVKRLVSHKILGFPESLPETTLASDDDSVLFWRGTMNYALPMENIDRIEASIENYRRVLAQRGIQLIVVPIPSKINVYADKVAAHHDLKFIEALNVRMSEAGIDYVDLKAPFLAARGAGEDIYFSDDTHWNEKGIAIAADVVAGKLAELEKRNDKANAEGGE